jgi:hypothetical protein
MHGYLLTVDPVGPRAADDDVDFLLTGIRLVVLASDCTRRQLVPVDAEGPNA